MKQVTINLYSFNELNDKAKEFAIAEHGNFLEEIGNEYEDEDGEMQTDYTRPTDTEIAENIEVNDYVYFEDGKLAACVTYTGKHEKTGKTEFTFHGTVYDITNS